MRRSGDAVNATGAPLAPRSKPESAGRERVWFAACGACCAAAALVTEQVATEHVAHSESSTPAACVALPVLAAATLALIVLRTPKRRPARWLSFVGGAAAVVVVAGAAYGWGPGVPRWRDWFDRDFDPAVWRDERDARTGERSRMMDDLLTRERLVRRPLAEIDALLGPDDRADDPSRRWEGWDRAWLLSDRGPNERWLILEVDPAGRVHDVRIEELPTQDDTGDLTF